MKKSLIILAIIFLLPLASSLEIDMKSQFDQHETLTAKISGNFVNPILKQNIFLKRGHVRTAFEPEVTKINDKYFIYGSLLNKNAGNYTLLIKGAEYYSGANIIDDDIELEFTISNQTAEFYALPGFIITNSTFQIKVQNLKDSTLSIGISTSLGTTDYPISPTTTEDNESFFSFFSSDSSEEKTIFDTSEESVSLKSGEIKNLKFIAKGFKQPTLKYLKLTSPNTNYEIPLQINQEDSTPEKKEQDLNFDKSDINLSLATEDELIEIIYLKNTGKQKLENIKLSLSEDLENFVKLSKTEIESLSSDSSIKIKLTIKSDDEGTYYGQLRANLEDNESITEVSSITLNFIENYVPPENNTEIENNSTDNETDFPPGSSSSGGSEDETDDENSGKLTGWIILAIVVVLLAWFFLKKYPSTRKKFDLIAAAKRKK